MIDNTNFPILILTFNRPQLLEKLVEHLIRLGASNLYVSIDGPRNEGDVEKQQEILTYLESLKLRVDRLEFIHHYTNLGCKVGVVAGIDWFFHEVQTGIILEDDCIPEDAFFQFVQDNLNKISTHSKAGMITAHNPLIDIKHSESVISRYSLITGWCTKAEVWKEIRNDFFQIDFPSKRNKNGNSQSLSEMIFWWAAATRARIGTYDTWDSCFSIQMWKHGKGCLIPPRNMVSNIGFGEEATHTKDPNGSIFLNTEESRFPSNRSFDNLLKTEYFRISPVHTYRPLFRVLFELIFTPKKINEEMKIRHSLEHSRKGKVKQGRE